MLSSADRGRSMLSCRAQALRSSSERRQSIEGRLLPYTFFSALVYRCLAKMRDRLHGV